MLALPLTLHLSADPSTMIEHLYNDFETMPDRYRVNFINSLSGFKSANLIGTLSKQQVNNLAIVSSVVHLGANPPLMAYINRPASVPRDTLDNILETGEFTINHVNNDIIEQSHQTSARYPAEESEFTATGLTSHFIDGFSAPFVEESRCKIGLSYLEHHTLLNNTVMVIGKVTHVLVSDNAVGEDGLIDIEALGTTAVSGLDTYHNPNKVVRMAYAKPGKKPSAL